MLKEKVSFRPMTVEDLPEILELEKKSCPAPWSKQTFMDELTRNHLAHYHVVTLDERAIGYCGMWMIIDEAHVTNLAIHPDFQGRGLGKALLMHMMAEAVRLGAKKMTLEVRASNHIAQSLYKKLGFTASGIRRGYYTDNHEDAIIMWVNLDEEEKNNAYSRD